MMFDVFLFRGAAEWHAAAGWQRPIGRDRAIIGRRRILGTRTMYSATIGARRYTFRDLKTLLAKATPLRSGDQLAGLAAETGEERVAAQYALADLPLATFLQRARRSLRDRRGDAPDRRHARPDGLRAGRASDGRRLPRLAAVRRGDDAGARRARARRHAGDGGGGQQDQPPAGPDGGGGEVLGGHALPQHRRPARPPVGAAAAQPSDRRRARHRGEHSRRPAARLRAMPSSASIRRPTARSARIGCCRCSTTSGPSSTSRRNPACWRMSRPRSS